MRCWRTLRRARSCWPTEPISDANRRFVGNQGVVPNIPSKPNRRWKSCLSITPYKGRNADERLFCRLSRATAASPPAMTKLAADFLGAI